MVIDTFMKMIENSSSKKSVITFSSFFYEKLKSKDFKKVKNWIKRKNILEYSKILIPVNVNSLHWALITIEPEEKRISYYDNLLNSNQVNLMFLIVSYVIIFSFSGSIGSCRISCK